MDSVTIGLDIGSSAVRAAEIEAGQNRRTLRRYGQVGLPHGAVVDGEIVNGPIVSAALKRLWIEGGFRSTKVVLGVSGPRVFVRQADVPALSAEDLRSALKFDAQELIPIPMDDASFDFSVLDYGPPTGADGKQTMRILIVAAHKDLLRGHMAALKGAGLTATAIDATPLSLLRAVPVTGPTGTEVLVSIGAEITTIAVREDGTPRFIRSLTVGGAKLTETIANAMHLEMASAERLKRGAVAPDLPQGAQARKAMSVELRDLAEDVRATVDFFVGQGEGSRIDRLLLTGGASQTEGLAAAIVGTLPTDVRQIDPFSALTIGDLGLTPDELRLASASATTAIGLALWPVESPLIKLSVLPDEVAAARRARRRMTMAATGVAGLAGLLGVVAVGQRLEVTSAQHQVQVAQQKVDALNGQVSQLEAATAVHSKMLSRATLVVTSLQGDIDWVRLLAQLNAVMPPNVTLTSFSGTRSGNTAGPSAPVTGSAPAATGAAPVNASSGVSSVSVGNLTFSVQGTGGLPTVAAWLTGLQKDQSLQGTWVSGISLTSNGGQVTFSSTSNITHSAQSTRAKAVQR